MMFNHLQSMALWSISPPHFSCCDIFGNHGKPFYYLPLKTEILKFIVGVGLKTIVAKRRGITQKKESAKLRNRRIQKKFNGTPTKPRLSVFCSTKQLYAMLVDDQNKKCLFYGSTLQKSLRDDPPCTTIEAAQSLGEELIKACIDLNINEISSYDRNGCSRGERMQAFEIAISRHGFLQDRSVHKS
ncbi:hypothetical protein Tsubulata_045793 [Turnera subulata]|uniref:50S ribosomal protein L18, chloroplastic n=1 Tax=Turnera subulata TaxID=218843 RepID=A0A9Q0J3G6_9ROSI|nr:hypothetical protein Tsubulata_045793 [Turnera subulata]